MCIYRYYFIYYFFNSGVMSELVSFNSVIHVHDITDRIISQSKFSKFFLTFPLNFTSSKHNNILCPSEPLSTAGQCNFTILIINICFTVFFFYNVNVYSS